jgi:hypothetical protein
MKLMVEIPDGATEGTARVITEYAVKDQRVFPYFDPEANHTFKTEDEFNDYWRRVAERNKNLAELPSEYVEPVDIPFNTFGQAVVEGIQPSRRYTYNTVPGAVVAFPVTIPEGKYDQQRFYAVAYEYINSGMFEIALSREPHQIEGAPARGVASRAPRVSVDIAPEGIFSPGRWYINVRCLAAEQGDTTTFGIEWGGPANHS